MGRGESRAEAEHSPAAILRFWRAVELFTPRRLQTTGECGRGERICDWNSGDELPWESGRPEEPDAAPGMTGQPDGQRGVRSQWRHVIYLGVFALERVAAELARRFGAEAASSGESEPIAGRACVAAFAATGDGRPLLASFSLASLAWSLGRTRRPGPRPARRLAGFEDAQGRARRAFAGRHPSQLSHSGEAVGRPLDAAAIEREAAQALARAGWPEARADLVALAAIRSSRVAGRGRHPAGGGDLLNSFFLDDLGRLAEDLGAGRASAALRAYLADPRLIDPERRLDVRGDLPAIRQVLLPRNFPPGRWPSAGHRPLVLSQQLAVNHIVGELAGGAGLVAVNGPPGTGKTTLLRDLIAAAVVRRADALAALPSPESAFAGPAGGWQTGGYRRSIRELCGELRGDEIVVASANNGAVENVTHEIPARRAIDASWIGDATVEAAGYFPAIASAVIGEPAWALLTAPLGKQRNCLRFVSRFWFGDQPAAAEGGKGRDGFLAVLRHAAAAAPPPWPAAVRRYREAREMVRRLGDERQAIADAIAEVPRLAAELDVAAAAAAAGRTEAARRRLKAARNRLEQARQAIADFRRTSGGVVPGEGFWQQAAEQRERASPWADPAWDRARASLFLAALALHRAFILAVPEPVRRNLQGAMDVLLGALPDGAPRTAVAAAWATFFLVVPVVSTTFASFARLFARVAGEGLGWLLIDEGGQAVPQAAAGAIARARRVVVVGDPRQLEPVTTIPGRFVADLRSHFGVAAGWEPGRLSVQGLADRTAVFGTYLARASRQSSAAEPGRLSGLWVGTPLRVHRRCEEPMFSIANRIAYSGLMVFGTEPRGELAGWPESCWFEVDAAESEGNWIAAEGRIAGVFLRSLPGRDRIACLTPFRHVVHGLRAMLGAELPGLPIGTIHTYQGKEQEAILLVLGGAIGRAAPLDWAARRPNLLNVAVTRARRRLYVIGSRHRWQTRPYFAELSRSLPTGKL
jgi:hypothetical protein